MKKTILIIFLLIFIMPKVHAYDLEWGPIIKERGRLLDLFPVTEKNFLALRSSGPGKYASAYFTRHVVLTLSATGRLKIKTKNDKLLFEKIISCREKTCLLLRDRGKKKNILYIQEVADNTELLKDPVELGEIPLDELVFGQNIWTFSSPNKQFFTIYWIDNSARKTSRTTRFFRIYDVDFKIRSEGQYSLPFEDHLVGISEYYLSNQGNLFMTVPEFSSSSKKKIAQRSKKMHLYEVIPGQLKEVVLDAGTKVLHKVKCCEIDNRLMVLGLYGDDQQSEDTDGIFVMAIGLEEGIVLKSSFKAFSAIPTGLMAEQKHHYKLSNLFVQDGAAYGAIEECEESHSSIGPTTGTGPVSTFHDYYFYDIKAFKINKNADFLWIQKIRKNQHSLNDGGQYGSYSSFLYKKELCFLFNDNSNNYDSTGNLWNTLKIRSRFVTFQSPVFYDPKANCVALVTISAEGEMNRKSLFTMNDPKFNAVPRLFRQYNNSILLCAISPNNRKKHRFGILKLGDK